MIRKTVTILFTSALIFLSGCVKETYDMARLSKKAHLSPTFGISVVRGNISISDLVDPNDTLVFDENNFIKLVFRKDSVIYFRMQDYYDLNDMVSFSQRYPVGELALGPFSGTISYSLDEISQKFDPALRAQFVALDGSTGNFPPFPAVNLTEGTFPLFTNFDYAEFSSGSISFSVTNNLPAPVYGITVTLYRTVGHTQIGNEIIVSNLGPGETGTGSLDLTGLNIPNSITANVTINGSPGADNVPVNLSNDHIQISISGEDLKVSSGRVILPVQTISTLDNHDTIPFDPGSDVEIDQIRINSGDLSFTLNSAAPLNADVSITLPTALRSGTPISGSFSVDAGSPFNGSLSVDNSTIDLGSVISQPYNLLPVDYSIDVSSGNAKIDFNSTDEISMDFKLLNPGFDYVKGYFGQQTESIEPDSLDLDIKEVLDHISGTLLLSNPSIKLNYSNSFSLPVRINFEATGYKGPKTIDLGLDTFPLSYPAGPSERDKTDFFSINGSNSSLPELVSMPPEKIRFSGSAVMNPQGNTGTRDNYLFGDSRFLGNLEIEIPMEMRIENLQLADTVDNFMKNDSPDSDSPLKAENFDFARIDISAKNGFPLGVSISMGLYDPVAGDTISSVKADRILIPAPVDINGKVTSPVDCETSIKITRDFWTSVDLADKIIITFKLNSTDDGSRDVKIYSDYKIDFKATMVLKPDIRFDLK